jgi:hypothetical protein
MHKIYGREKAKQRSEKEERKSQHIKFYVIPHKTDEIWAEEERRHEDEGDQLTLTILIDRLRLKRREN